MIHPAVKYWDDLIVHWTKVLESHKKNIAETGVSLANGLTLYRLQWLVGNAKRRRKNADIALDDFV